MTALLASGAPSETPVIVGVTLVVCLPRGVDPFEDHSREGRCSYGQNQTNEDCAAFGEEQVEQEDAAADEQGADGRPEIAPQPSWLVLEGVLVWSIAAFATQFRSHLFEWSSTSTLRHHSTHDTNDCGSRDIASTATRA